MEVPRAEWSAAFDGLDGDLQDALEVAAKQIEAFHEKQKRTSWVDFSDEGALGQLVVPLDRIGVYAPGGSAVYPSSLLMTAVPARVAGVREIVVCSPPRWASFASDSGRGACRRCRSPLSGRRRPGNCGAGIWNGVRSACRQDLRTGQHIRRSRQRKVFGVVAIDQLPGPTETLIVADDSADPQIAAANMLAQAEHDPMASAILITNSSSLAEEVADQLRVQLPALPRAAIAEAALRNNGMVVVVGSIDTAIELANQYAPEHLCLLLHDPWAAVSQVRNAGGIFVGEQSPEALGDYTAGPSHVMPTGGTARFFSPIHLADFTKVVTIAAANQKAVERLGPATMTLARAEGLEAHARAVSIRLEKTPVY